MLRFARWQQVHPQDSRIRLARVPSSQIGFLNSLVESYEGIGILRTRDPKRGIVEFWIMPDWQREFLLLIDKLQSEIPIVWIPRADAHAVYGIVDGRGYAPQTPGAITPVDSRQT